ncbi:hypothetical protein BgiMline_005914, partial [Biomphalaria glabrata]
QTFSQTNPKKRNQCETKDDLLGVSSQTVKSKRTYVCSQKRKLKVILEYFVPRVSRHQLSGPD